MIVYIVIIVFKKNLILRGIYKIPKFGGVIGTVRVHEIKRAPSGQIHSDFCVCRLKLLVLHGHSRRFSLRI